MKILKLKDPANECIWTPTDKIAFMNIITSTEIELKIAGLNDDLAFDKVTITTDGGRVNDVAANLAGLIGSRKSGLIDVVALDGVDRISRLFPA
jgi:hypothetical protein